VVDRVEPGSTFKLITAAAAVASGVVSMEDTVDTGPGWVVLHGRTLRDTHAYGRIPFREVVALSSNIGAARVAERTPPEDFFRMARSLGFGMTTGIDIPGEVGGKLKRVRAWSRSTLSAMSRGYEVSATPLQILTAYAALANGGVLVRPHVVAEIRDVTGGLLWKAEPDSIRRVFGRDLAETLLPAFEQVVTEGTAREAAIPGVRVAGKTGTAWKVKNGVYSSRHSTASFVGFFPAEDPVVAMIVLMDEPSLSIYGGVVAAPVFREIGRRWLPTLNALPATPESVPTDSIRAPRLTGFPTTLASARLLSSGLRTRPIREENTVVLGQSPSGNRPTFLGARMQLNTGPADDGLMPDLTGWTIREASYWLAVKGVSLRVEGSGSIQRQLPAPGAQLPATARVTAGD
jgi:cell division protein FtsI (penicillin-binding protein 3)